MMIFKSTSIHIILIIIISTIGLFGTVNPIKYHQDQEQLPDCSHTKPKLSQEKNILLVSTLDGTVSALDIANKGQLLWSHTTDPGFLISSTIDNFELINNGQLVRLIPSLDGNLYKYNGHSVEPIPLSADHLLKSSFKLGDDLVIAGGKESKIYGIDATTGRLVYECGYDGCYNDGKSDNESNGNILIVKRQTQKVRAIEPKTGVEKWNFTVAEHQVSVLKDIKNCGSVDKINNVMDIQENRSNENIKVIIPEGLVSVSDDQKSIEKWNHKFDVPIANFWLIKNGEILTVDLFHKDIFHDPFEMMINPVLYIGFFGDQFYVQHSKVIKEQLAKFLKLAHESDKLPQIEWKPHKINSESTSLIATKDNVFNLETQSFEYVGYYLFDKKKPEQQCNIPENISSNNVVDDYENITTDSIDQIIIVSLWHYWREVLFISIVLAIAINLGLTFLKRKLKIIAKNCEVTIEDDCCFKLSDTPKENSNNSISFPTTPTESSTLTNSTTPSGIYEGSNFVSRFKEDFESIQRLGKGGYGIVFQVKNRIDDCEYAVKRITLPQKHEAREKMLREAKALAKIDHINVVRYYNSWLEVPPIGWQEGQDKEWERFNEFSINTATDFSKSRYDKLNSNLNSVVESTSQSWKEKVTKTEQGYDSLTDSYVKFENSKIDKVEQEEPTTQSCSVMKQPKRPDSLIPLPKAYLYIQMQLCQKETLREWLLTNGNRQKSQIYDIFIQIVDAVEYVHNIGFMHRDLKPSNIYFTADGCVKIGDFGLATTSIESLRTPVSNESGDNVACDPLSNGHTLEVGTKLYMSPEQIKGASYSNKVDIYSLGVIFFELMVPFSTHMERVKILCDVRIQDFPTSFINNNSQECNLLKRLLSVDPNKRPSASEIKLDPLLKDHVNCNRSSRSSSRGHSFCEDN